MLFKNINARYIFDLKYLTPILPNEQALRSTRLIGSQSHTVHVRCIPLIPHGACTGTCYVFFFSAHTFGRYIDEMFTCQDECSTIYRKWEIITMSRDILVQISIDGNNYIGTFSACKLIQ